MSYLIILHSLLAAWGPTALAMRSTPSYEQRSKSHLDQALIGKSNDCKHYTRVDSPSSEEEGEEHDDLNYTKTFAAMNCIHSNCSDVEGIDTGLPLPLKMSMLTDGAQDAFYAMLVLTIKDIPVVGRPLGVATETVIKMFRNADGEELEECIDLIMSQQVKTDMKRYTTKFHAIADEIQDLERIEPSYDTKIKILFIHQTSLSTMAREIHYTLNASAWDYEVPAVPKQTQDCIDAKTQEQLQRGQVDERFFHVWKDIVFLHLATWVLVDGGQNMEAKIAEYIEWFEQINRKYVEWRKKMLFVGYDRNDKGYIGRCLADLSHFTKYTPKSFHYRKKDAKEKLDKKLEEKVKPEYEKFVARHAGRFKEQLQNVIVLVQKRLDCNKEIAALENQSHASVQNASSEWLDPKVCRKAKDAFDDEIRLKTRRFGSLPKLRRADSDQWRPGAKWLPSVPGFDSQLLLEHDPHRYGPNGEVVEGSGTRTSSPKAGPSLVSHKSTSN